MKNTHKATPVAKKTVSVVEKKDVCTCTDACSCGTGCDCDKAKTLITCVTMLVSALIVAGSILLTGSTCPMKKARPHLRPMPPAPVAAVAGEPANVEKQIRDFVANNPKFIIDAVDSYYKKLEQKQQEPALSDKEMKKVIADIVADKTNNSLGNPKGKFVIIEFFDYQCGWCKKTNKEMAAAVASKEGKNIRWIPVDSPIFGEDSERISRFVMAAAKQEKYAEMHEAVSNATGKLDEAKLIELAKGLKLDTKKLKADAESDAIKKKLAANRELANKLGVRGVPMLIVDGKVNPGALIGDKLAEAVKASQAKK